MVEEEQGRSIRRKELLVSQSIPGRRQLDFQDWPEVLADIERLQEAGYLRTGNWELSQMLEHLGEGLRTAVRGTDHRGAWIIRKLIGPILLRRILRQRRMAAGVKVPDWWLPGPSHDESVAVDQFHSEIKSFEEMTGSAHPHPLLGAMTKKQWRDLALIHAAHHLSFLSPIR